jgi:S1-C subfamily serine protease
MFFPIYRSCVGVLFFAASIVSAQDKPQEHLPKPAPTPTPTLESIIERVRPSIVQIVVNIEFRIQEKPDKIPAHVNGSGFIVDSAGHIATAGHVVNAALIHEFFKKLVASSGQNLIDDTFRITTIEIKLPAPSGLSSNGNLFYDYTDALSGTVLAQDDTIDVAVLLCNRNPLTLPSGATNNGRPVRPLAEVPNIQTNPPHDGDMISVSGFPLDIPVLVTNTGWIASVFYMDERKKFLYLGDISVNQGNSGGPAYSDVDGRIIGVVTAYRNAPEGGNSRLAVIVPIQGVLDLLKTVKTN